MLGSKQQSNTHLFPTAWETGKPNSEVTIGLVLGLLPGSWRTSVPIHRRRGLADFWGSFLKGN